MDRTSMVALVAFKYQDKEKKKAKVTRLTDLIREETGLSRGVAEGIADALVRGREVDRLAVQKGWPLEDGTLTGPKGSITLIDMAASVGVKIGATPDVLSVMAAEKAEQDVEDALREFDQKVQRKLEEVKDGRKSVPFNASGFSLEIQYLTAWSKSKPWVISVQGTIKTSKKTLPEAVQYAREAYEKFVRKALKVKKVQQKPETGKKTPSELEAEAVYRELKRREKAQKYF